MELESTTVVDFPSLYIDITSPGISFYFKKYSDVNHTFFTRKIVKCFVKKKKYLSPLIGEVYNTSDFIIELFFKKNTNVILNISFFCKIKKRIRFKNFFDFEYTTGTGENFLYSRSKFMENNGNSFLKRSLFLPIDIIPLFFCNKYERPLLQFTNVHSQLSGIYCRQIFRENKEFTCVRVLATDKRSLLSKKKNCQMVINFHTGLSPKICKKKKNIFLIPNFGIGFFIKIFKKRPIWIRKKLENFLPLSLKRYLKKILPILAYRFDKKNPFKKSWVRFGFDPRKIKKSVVFQTLGILKNEKKKKIGKKNKRIKLRKNLHLQDIFFLKSIQIQKNFFGQICDLDNHKIKKYFEIHVKKKVLHFIHSFTGWLDISRNFRFRPI